MKLLHTMLTAIAGVAVCLLATFALPIESWRTGERRQLAPLVFEPPEAGPDAPTRVWIDTDAACGSGPRTDPDDCFAIAMLARAPNMQIVGISTVFGNAPREVVHRTTIELAARLSAETGRALPVHEGSTVPLADQEALPPRPAHEALAAALERGPLTMIALGPLTNLALVLSQRPDLRSNITQLVAVMGRRPGHLFHPAEGSQAGMLFGHGPVFRDFNFAMDEQAASQVFALNLPTRLIPYEAARGIEITASDLDRFAASSTAMAWIAEKARPWLSYWRESIGRQGFYPFDLLAAAYAIEPSQFKCAKVRAWVGEDGMLFGPLWHPVALLVDQGDLNRRSSRKDGLTLYCATATVSLKSMLLSRLGALP